MSESLTSHQLNELFGMTGNKIDASKLNTAWMKAGSPTDSDAVAKILQDAGVDTAVISKAYADMNITAPTAASTDTNQPSSDKTTGSDNIQDLLAQIMKLSAAEQKQVLAHLKK
jgi:arylsulfatase A-like enzyme